MTPDELYTAVMATPGPLDDEIMARIWCLVHGHGYVGCERFTSEIRLTIRSGGNKQIQWIIMGEWERPDISTDAALGLVHVKFPYALDLLEKNHNSDGEILHQYTFRFLNRDGMTFYGENEQHKDRRLAILAALLKAMETQ